MISAHIGTKKKKQSAVSTAKTLQRGILLPGSSVVTLTFGECAENHVGMQKIGCKGETNSGLTVQELEMIRTRLTAMGHVAELLQLGGNGMPDAAVLVIRDGVNALLEAEDGARSLFSEHASLEHDTKALMRGRVVEKWARGNLCYSDTAQEPDYAAGKGRIVAYDSIPLTQRLRVRLPTWFGAKAEGMSSVV
jgi:hypothetical protein